MQIYFTGANSFKDEQKDKDKSLGGYMASTRVPNDVFGNLFGEVSYYGLSWLYLDSLGWLKMLKFK